MPYLIVEVTDDSVTARFALPQPTGFDVAQRIHGPGTLQNLPLVRPIFRGRIDDRQGGTRLQGRFGLNTLSRATAVGALLALVVLILTPHVQSMAILGLIPWIALVAFVVMCPLTRRMPAIVVI